MRLPQPVLHLMIGLAVLIAAPRPAVEPPPENEIFVGGRKVVLSDPTVSIGDRLLVPIRAYVEALGGAVTWQAPDKIVAQFDENVLEMRVGSQTALVNGSAVRIPNPVQEINGIAYMPHGFLSEAIAENPPKKSTVTVPPPPPVEEPGKPVPPPTAAGDGDALVNVSALPAGAQLPTPTNWPPDLGLQHYLNRETGFLEIDGTCVGGVPIIDDYLFVPLRRTMEQVGGEARWLKGSALVKFGKHYALITPYSTHAYVDGGLVILPTPPIVADGNVLVPGRFLATALDLKWSWDVGRWMGNMTGGGGKTGDMPCAPTSPVAAYIVMDAGTGTVLSEFNADKPVPLASITKIMTALLALERGDRKSVVKVSSFAANQIGTSAYLNTGERRTLDELLYGLMIPSGNDAAVAIAEHLSGSESAFAKLMNQRASTLGAKNTKFVTASGLDDSAFSSARDMAKVTRQALTLPQFRKIVTTLDYSTPDKVHSYSSNNDFVRGYKGATGGKSGWTEGAGYTLVSSANRDGRELILVVLGAQYRTAVYEQTYRLMDYAFRLARNSWSLNLSRR